MNYYTNAEKKVITLASSNLEEVAEAAKGKLKLIANELKALYEWETKLRKLIEVSEELKAKRDERLFKEKRIAEIKAEIKLIDDHIRKRETPQALHLAKKLAAAYFESPAATDTLDRVQKLYDKTRSKEELGAEEIKRRDRFFREAGIKHVDQSADTLINTERKKTGVLQQIK